MAAKAALTEEHPPLPSVPGDDNNYVLGRIGPHNVVIASLPSGTYGTNAAAVTANHLSRTFPHLKFGLMVGIGGGVPKLTGNPTSHVDVRLGDVTVGFPNGSSPGVIQYDLGKTKEGSPPERTGSLNKPPRVLLNAVAALKVRYDNEPTAFATQVRNIVRSIGKHNPALSIEYSMPPVETDILFATGNVHQGSGDTCESCDSSRTIERKTRQDANIPSVHYGTIASGNQVLRNSVIRDRLRDEDSVICVEMEAAGLDNFPSIIIRGVCDYADSHKAKEWQPYAAITAAAYAKDLLMVIAPDVSTETTINQQRSEQGNIYWSVPRSSHPYFTGREEICDRLITAFCRSDELRFRGQKRFVITGIGGTGKSEVCLKFVEDHRDDFWGIFWVDVSDRQTDSRSTTKQTAESFPTVQQDYLKIGQMCGVLGESIDHVKRWLSNCNYRWLLILDNADNPDLDYSTLMPSGDRGNIILTSRNRSCGIYQTVGHECLDMLPSDLARNLLLRASELPESSWTERSNMADKIVEKLGSHTLALVQAGAYIRQRHCSLEEYARLFSQQREKMMRTDSRQLPSTYGSIHETFEVSIKYLESMVRQDSKDALQLLEILAFMHFEGVSEDIVRRAAEGAKYIRDRGDTKLHLRTLSRLCIENTEELPEFLLQHHGAEFDKLRWREACSLLESLALLTITSDTSFYTLSMHPLVHDWLLSRQTSHSKMISWRIACSIISVPVYRYPNSHTVCRSLYPHLKACTSDYEQFFQKHKTRLVYKMMVQLYRIAYRMSDENLASSMFNSLSSAIQEGIDENVDMTGELRYIQGLVMLYEVENFAGARVLFENVLQKREAILDINQHHIEVVRDALIQTELKLDHAEPHIEMIKRDSRFEEAICLFKTAVKAREKTAVFDDPWLLNAQQDLGQAYCLASQYEQAIEVLDRVVLVREDLMDPANPDLLASKHILAKAHTGAEQYERAINILKKVVEVEALIYSLTDCNSLVSLHTLSEAYYGAAQYDKAFELARDALEAAGYEEVAPLAEDADVQSKARIRIQELWSCYSEARDARTEGYRRQIALSDDMTSREINANTELLGESDVSVKTEKHSKRRSLGLSLRRFFRSQK